MILLGGLHLAHRPYRIANCPGIDAWGPMSRAGHFCPGSYSQLFVLARVH